MTVEDIDWHPKDENRFASVGNDKIINIWDLRDTKKASQSRVDAHDGDIHGVAFNPRDEFEFATASADTTVKLWDLRNMKRYVRTNVLEMNEYPWFHFIVSPYCASHTLSI